MNHFDLEENYEDHSIIKEFLDENVFDDVVCEKSIKEIAEYFEKYQDGKLSNLNYNDGITETVENCKRTKDSISKKISVTLGENSKKIKSRLLCSYPNCKKNYSTERLLQNHMNSHTKKKLYNCDHLKCGKVYKSKENLNLHVKNKHLGVKPYKCSFCESKFTHRNGKTYHERIFHSLYFPYKCGIINCDKSFASKSSLNYHTKNKH